MSLTELFERILQAVSGTPVRTPPQVLPGVGPAAAYTAGDAMGTKGYIEGVPTRGVILTARFYDRDNEKLAMDLVLFNQDFTATADNAAFAPSASDLQKIIGTISWTSGDFKAFSANAVATVFNVGLGYEAPEGRLYFQAVAQGAANIASGAEPLISLVIL